MMSHTTNSEPTKPQLIDSFERVHNNLRISVTDRCNIRCFYCMPSGEVQFMDRHELLTFEEIERFARIAVSLGVNKVRLTGGEPLVRRDLHLLVEKLAEIPGIRDIGLTTNGILLPDQAQRLYDAGLRRINISLDTLDRETFQHITQRDELARVLEGIQAAKRAGFSPVKINAVAIRNLTEKSIIPLGQYARDEGVDVRFIEFMPLDASNAWERDKVLFGEEIIETLNDGIMPLVSFEDQDPKNPATEFVFEDGIGRIGLIASVSQPFCLSCNRFRLTADGRVRNCLFSLEETDVKTLLRGGSTDDDIATAVRKSIADKNEGHDINTSRFIRPDRPMYLIGG